MVVASLSRLTRTAYDGCSLGSPSQFGHASTAALFSSRQPHWLHVFHSAMTRLLSVNAVEDEPCDCQRYTLKAVELDGFKWGYLISQNERFEVALSDGSQNDERPQNHNDDSESFHVFPLSLYADNIL